MANKSISYIVDIKPSKLDNEEQEGVKRIVAATEDKIQVKDLYFNESILVSSVWNLNDDIFTPEEIAAAKDTPVNKPSNANHEEKVIVGHILSAYLVDDKLDPVGEVLPDLVHLITKNVIYRTWSDPQHKEMVENIIAAIDLGQKYVSMECGFTNFDYGLMDSKGNISIVERNEGNSFLSKYLRCYGGEGTFQGHKVGRVLRNITFIGKGYVDNPANPSSVIFSKSNIKIKSGVSILQTSSLLEAEMDQIEELNKKITELTEACTNLQAKVDELTNSNASLAEEKAAQAAELETIKKEQTKAKRIAKFTQADVELTIAEEKVAFYADLNDTMFDAVAEEVIAAEKAKKAAKEKDMKGMPCSKSEEVVVVVEPKVEPAVAAQAVAAAVEPENLETKVTAQIAEMLGNRFKDSNKKNK